MMGPIPFQDGMETGVGETGGDTEEIQGGFQEGTTQATALLIEIFKDAVLGEGDGHIRLALMGEDGSLDGGDTE